MPDTSFDVVVIGAGHAGLSSSYCLSQYGLRHVVLERGRIGESWRSQRWDSFVLNSPNRFNVLPGDTYRGSNPEGFDSGKSFTAYLQEYAGRFRLPVQENSRVVSVMRNSSAYHVTAQVNGASETYTCRKIVVASGGMNEFKLPSFARSIPSSIQQLHTGEYRSPALLPDGAVLIVGSAQSGLQIAEELIEAGRRVFLSTSAVGRVPRRYRGRDILDWLFQVGFFDTKTEDVTNPKELDMRQPQVSGVGPLGHTLSLQSLARAGAVIVGRIRGVRGSLLQLQPDAGEHVRFGDELSARMKLLIDQYIMKHRLEAPLPEPDPAVEPDPNASSASTLMSLHLGMEQIRSIIWATGFGGDFRYLPEHVLDEGGWPLHRNGVSGGSGIYFVGLPWLRKRKSGVVHGIVEDAPYIAELVSQSPD